VCVCVCVCVKERERDRERGRERERILDWTIPLAELFLNDLVVDKVSVQQAISKPLDLEEASSHRLRAWAMIDPVVVRGVGWW